MLINVGGRAWTCRLVGTDEAGKMSDELALAVTVFAVQRVAARRCGRRRDVDIADLLLCVVCQGKTEMAEHINF